MMKDTREDVSPTLPAIRAANTYPWIRGIQPKSFVRVRLCGLWRRMREGEMFERSEREGGRMGNLSISKAAHLHLLGYDLGTPMYCQRIEMRIHLNGYGIYTRRSFVRVFRACNCRRVPGSLKFLY